MLLALHAMVLPVLAAADSDDALAERRVKAAYLYRFASYVQWPDDAFAAAADPLVIGVWGHDEIAEDIAGLVAGRSVDGRRIEARRVRDGEALANLHILFVARARHSRVSQAIDQLPARGTLVVTEAAGALRQGSAINFVLVDGQVRFELAPDAAERRGLKLSSRLVAIAQAQAGRPR